MLGNLSVWLGGAAIPPALIPAVAIPVIAVGAALGLLLAAAWHDVRARLIPDGICIILAIAGCVFRLRLGIIDFAFSATVALILFFLLFAAFSRGIVGGGDVKLIVATGLWLSPPDCYGFLVATAMAGGVLAVVHLLVRELLARGAIRVGDIPAVSNNSGKISLAGMMHAELERIRQGYPLPYGVAIAIGGWYSLLMTFGG